MDRYTYTYIHRCIVLPVPPRIGNPVPEELQGIYDQDRAKHNLSLSIYIYIYTYIHTCIYIYIYSR